LTTTEPLWFPVKRPACKVNDPELFPAGIVSEPGPVRAVFVVDTTTLAPFPDVVFVSVTTQLLVLCGARLDGLQETPEISTGATRLIDTFFELLP
jgi:hypothetical protein